MHAIHPQSPRMLAALVAAFVLMLIAMALPSQLGDIDVGSPTASPPAAEAAPAERPAWASNPLASPIDRLKTPPR